MEYKWWENCFVYQIYPKSFKDTTDSGMGDIRGITEKLDYLKWLGIGALWLCPIYDSPQIDNGYDIRDYEKISTIYGSEKDFEELLREAHEKDIRIIMDLVVNHTSSEHIWFKKALEDKDSPYRDWYIWRKGKDGKEPNNWSSFFTPSAWAQDKNSNEWYLHLFAEEQPDLNWENPDLRQNIYSMINNWFDKGVDGFRMDVITLIAKDQNMPDAEGIPNSNGYVFGSDYFAIQPKIHEYLQEMRNKCFAGRNVMCVGEGTCASIEEADRLTRNEKELDQIFQFDLLDIDSEGCKWNSVEFSPSRFKAVLDAQQRTIRWNTLFLGNHDQPRVVSRFGSTASPLLRKASSKLLALVEYMAKGTPYLYQGEEIGMANFPFNDQSQLRDIESLNYLASMIIQGREAEGWQAILKHGRDNARTPMQWNAEEGAGFTDGIPWIAINPDHTNWNVEDEMKDPDSVLNFYRLLIRTKTNSETLTYGDYIPLKIIKETIISYMRIKDNATYKVIANMSGDKVDIDLNLNKYEVILNTRNCIEKHSLEAYQGLLLREV